MPAGGKLRCGPTAHCAVRQAWLPWPQRYPLCAGRASARLPMQRRATRRVLCGMMPPQCSAHAKYRPCASARSAHQQQQQPAAIAVHPSVHQPTSQRLVHHANPQVPARCYAVELPPSFLTQPCSIHQPPSAAAHPADRRHRGAPLPHRSRHGGKWCLGARHACSSLRICRARLVIAHAPLARLARVAARHGTLRACTGMSVVRSTVTRMPMC